MTSPDPAHHPIVLTPEQRACIDHPADGSLVVTGIAGGGKTLVIVARAAKLMRRPRGVSDVPPVRVFTFNHHLAHYIRTLARALGEEPPLVDTFHAWAISLLGHIGAPRATIGPDKLAGLIDHARYKVFGASRATRLARLDRHGWSDEIGWIKGRELLTFDQYVAADRSARGSLLDLETPADFERAFALFRAYQQGLERLVAWDFDDQALAVLAHRDRIPDEFRADHVLVDEAQDLTPAAIRALHAAARGSITIAADKAQNIYNTRFDWAAIDVDPSRDVRHLTRSFRSPRTIGDAARSLWHRDPALSFAETDAPAIYSTGEGQKPLLLRLRRADQLIPTIKRCVDRARAEAPEEVVAVLHRHRHVLDSIAANLGRPVRYLYRDDTDFVSPGVVLSTFHAAKGLEFDHVILAGIDERIFPEPHENDDPTDTDSAVARARRVLYVGLTRARRAVVLVAGPDRSRFLDEIDGALLQEIAIA